VNKRQWIENPMGHVWETNDNGAVDAFAMSAGDHNGPRCVVCGYSFCEHCQDMPSESCTGETQKEKV